MQKNSVEGIFDQGARERRGEEKILFDSGAKGTAEKRSAVVVGFIFQGFRSELSGFTVVRI